MSQQEVEVSDVVVVLDDMDAAKLDALVARLKEAGLAVSDIDPDNDVIEGTVESTKLKSLEKLEGVKYVRNVFTYVAEPPNPDGDEAEDEEEVGR